MVENLGFNVCLKHLVSYTLDGSQFVLKLNSRVLELISPEPTGRDKYRYHYHGRIWEDRAQEGLSAHPSAGTHVQTY